MTRNKPFRLHHRQRILNKVDRQIKLNHTLEGTSEEYLATLRSIRYQTRCTCSCWMCGNVKEDKVKYVSLSQLLKTEM